MKTFVALIFLVLSSHAVADWVRIGETRIFVSYIDPATIRRNGNLVKLWMLTDFKTIQLKAAVPFWSMKAQSEFDCTEELWRVLYASEHTENMGRGRRSARNNAVNAEWFPISPGAMEETLWNVACKK